MTAVTVLRAALARLLPDQNPWSAAVFRKRAYWFKKQFVFDADMSRKKTSVAFHPFDGCDVGFGLRDLIDRVVIGASFLFYSDSPYSCVQRHQGKSRKLPANAGD